MWDKSYASDLVQAPPVTSEPWGWIHTDPDQKQTKISYVPQGDAVGAATWFGDQYYLLNAVTTANATTNSNIFDYDGLRRITQARDAVSAANVDDPNDRKGVQPESA